MQTLTAENRRFFWNWRKDFTYFCVVFSEVLWLAPLIYLVIRDVFGSIALPTALAYVMVNVVASMSVRRLLIHLRWTSYQQFPVFMLGVFISLLCSIAVLPIMLDRAGRFDLDFIGAFRSTDDRFGDGILLIPIVLWLWLRGITVGKSFLTATGVSMRMRFGILVFFMLALLSPRVLQEDLLLIVPLFFTTSLMATALIRAATLKIEEHNARQRFGRSWLGFLVAVVTLLNLTAFIFALIMGEIDRDNVLDVFKLLLVGFLTLIFIVAAPFLFIMELLFGDLEIENLPQEIPSFSGNRPSENAEDGDRVEWWDTAVQIFETLSTAIGILFLVGIFTIILIFWISFLLNRENLSFDDHDAENADRREIMGGLRKLLANRFRKLTDTLRAAGQFGFGRDLFHALTIRWAYSRMEHIAKKRGFPRDTSQTPYEYRKLLAQAYPGGDIEIRTITEAYVKVRYGELPEDNNELSAVRDALTRLREIAHLASTGQLKL